MCSPHYLSSSSPHSSCTWRGVWSVHLECRSQVAAVIGPGSKPEEQSWHAAAEVYLATNSTSLPPLPEDYDYGVAAYIGGSLVYCGGLLNDDPTMTPTSSCHRLTPPLLQWEETFPLLQVIPLISPLPHSRLCR